MEPAVRATVSLHLHRFVGSQDAGRKNDSQTVRVHSVCTLLLCHSGQMENETLQHVVVHPRQLVDVTEQRLHFLLSIADRGGQKETLVEIKCHQRLGHFTEEGLCEERI